MPSAREYTNYTQRAPVLVHLCREAFVDGSTPDESHCFAASIRPMAVTIPGATKVHQGQQNAGAMVFHLTDDEMARQDELSQRA